MYRKLLLMAISPLLGLGWAFAADAPAAPLGWDLSQERFRTGESGWSDDFGPLAESTAEGLRFQIDRNDHRLWFRRPGFDTARNTHLEIFHRGPTALFGVYVYGPGEQGFDAQRRLNAQWTANTRFHPNRKVLNLNDIPRYRQGNIAALCLAFANSGEGLTGVISHLAFRRGADTLENGALLLRDAQGLPLYWSIEHLTRINAAACNGLPGVAIAGGRAATELHSLKPAHRYRASVYARNLASAAAEIRDQAGQVLLTVELKKTADAPANGFARYEANYTVPKMAYSGSLILQAAGPAEFGDALVEDLGGAENYHAEWIWTPEGAKDSQNCYFRREFDLADPAAIQEAFLQATCDDAFTLEINDQRLFNNNNWSNPQFSEVKKHLKAGRNVITASGWNASSAAGFIAELRLTDRQGKRTYIATDSSWLCRTSDPGDHWRRIVPPAATRAGWVPVRALGKPPVPPWGVNVRYMDKPPVPTARQAIDKEAFAQRKTTARINRELNYPRMEINGQIADPVLFGIRWRGDRTENYRTVNASGLGFYRLMWEFSFEAWHADGSIDYRALDAAVEELLAANPDGKIILVIRISPPTWWQRQYPGELVKFADGTTSGADGTFASPASEVYRQTIAAKLGEAVRHIEGSWYSSAIAGYMPCNLRGPEWVLAAKHNCFPDYSTPMRAAFRAYLREKYQNDPAALRRAWRNPAADFDTAEIPPQNRRQLEKNYFLPADRQDVMDYTRALQRASVDTIMTVMDAVHANAPQKLRVLYFGYLMTLTHISNTPGVTGHYDLMRLLNAGKVDVFASPASYVWRKPGDISGVGSVESTFRKHGVVWLHEADNRTCLTEADEHANTFNMAASLTENHREFIYSLVKRNPLWFYDLGGGWYDHAYFQRDFAKQLALYREAYRKPVSYTPSAAMFFDEKFVDAVTLADGRWGGVRPYTMAAEAQKALAASGVPYDIFELEDLYSLDLAPYQALIFPNAWRKNPKLAQFLREKVFPAGKTAVFLYAAGYGEGGGVAGMRELTGMTVKAMPENSALVYTAADGRRIGNPGMKLAEVFAVNDPAVEAMGRYRPSGAVAAARKKLGAGASVLLPIHDPSGRMLRDILQQAGADVLVDRFDRVVFDGEYFGIVATDGPGPRTVSLPNAMKLQHVTDLFSGEELELSDGEFTLDLKPGDARIFQCVFE